MKIDDPQIVLAAPVGLARVRENRFRLVPVHAQAQPAGGDVGGRTCDRLLLRIQILRQGEHLDLQSGVAGETTMLSPIIGLRLDDSLNAGLHWRVVLALTAYLWL